jgi:hypothetical protein
MGASGYGFCICIMEWKIFVFGIQVNSMCLNIDVDDSDQVRWGAVLESSGVSPLQRTSGMVRSMHDRYDVAHCRSYAMDSFRHVDIVKVT